MDDRDAEWVARVFSDWTTLQILEDGAAFAFNRETGRVYKLPHPDCPFVQFELRYTITARGRELLEGKNGR
jgi:hypothetical protein